MADACPECGAELYVSGSVGDLVEYREYTCGTRRWPNMNRPMLHRNECLTRQLAQRDELIAALKPVVRAADQIVNEADGEHWDLYWHSLRAAVDALPPEVRKAMEVEG